MYLSLCWGQPYNQFYVMHVSQSSSTFLYTLLAGCDVKLRAFCDWESYFGGEGMWGGLCSLRNLPGDNVSHKDSRDCGGYMNTFLLQ